MRGHTSLLLALALFGCADRQAGEGGEETSQEATGEATATPEGSEAPTAAPTEEPSEAPTGTPTPAATPAPTEVPTPEPTPSTVERLLQVEDNGRMYGTWHRERPMQDGGLYTDDLTCTRDGARMVYADDGETVSVKVASSWGLRGEGEFHFTGVRPEGEPESAGDDFSYTGCVGTFNRGSGDLLSFLCDGLDGFAYHFSAPL